MSLHFAQIPNGSLSNTFMEKPTHFHTISTDLEKKIDTNLFFLSFPRQKRLECEYKWQIWSISDVIATLHFDQIPSRSLSNTFIEKPAHFHTFFTGLEKKIYFDFLMTFYEANCVRGNHTKMQTWDTLANSTMLNVITFYFETKIKIQWQKLTMLFPSKDVSKFKSILHILTSFYFYLITKCKRIVDL